MTLMKMRVDFLFTDFSQHFGINLVVFALQFFIHGHRRYEVRIMLETSNLARKYTPICSFRKYTI